MSRAEARAEVRSAVTASQEAGMALWELLDAVAEGLRDAGKIEDADLVGKGFAYSQFPESGPVAEMTP